VHRLRRSQMQPRQFASSISRVAGSLLIVGGLMAAVSPAWAGQLVPFSGSLQAHEMTVAEDPGISFVTDGTGDGIATHLGRFTLDWEFTVNLSDGTGSGPARYIAANGDQLFLTAEGRSEPTATPGVFRIVEVFTINDGTGRFDGARGSFTVERLFDFATGLTSGSFHGMISSPGRHR
jgi:hypothetical protein